VDRELATCQLGDKQIGRPTELSAADCDYALGESCNAGFTMQILEDPESSPGDRNIYQATEESVINSRRMRRFDHLQQ
jgi:hypothetical protein